MYKLGLLVVLVAFASVSAQMPDPHDCHICEFLVAIARHHFNNNVTDEGALKTQLLEECTHLSNPQDQTTCTNMVNKNIDKIYADMKMGDMSGQTCVDIGYCTPAMTGFPTGMTGFPTTKMARKMRHAKNPMLKKGKRQQRRRFPIFAPATTTPSPDECRECERMIGYAEYWMHRNPNATQAQLQNELHMECNHSQNPQNCVTFVDAHITTIWNDLKAGKRPSQTCADLNLCMPMTTPMFKKAKRQRHFPIFAATTPSPAECQECERIIGYAEYWLHRNPNATMAQLQAELHGECNHTNNPQKCDTFIDAHITTIWNDLKAGKRPSQTCADLNLCNPPTTMAPVFRAVATTTNFEQGCGMCDRVMGYAEYFYHKNPSTTQADLQKELDGECQHQMNPTTCQTMVDNNIATIYTDLKNGKRGYQICEDLGFCPINTTPMPKA